LDELAVGKGSANGSSMDICTTGDGGRGFHGSHRTAFPARLQFGSVRPVSKARSKKPQQHSQHDFLAFHQPHTSPSLHVASIPLKHAHIFFLPNCCSEAFIVVVVPLLEKARYPAIISTG